MKPFEIYNTLVAFRELERGIISRGIAELLAKIPRGTVCTEDNHCGGFLTEGEERQLNELFRLQRELLEAEGDSLILQGRFAPSRGKNTDGD